MLFLTKIRYRGLVGSSALGLYCGKRALWVDESWGQMIYRVRYLVNQFLNYLAYFHNKFKF